ncbi:hypothetical protein Hsc_0501 [Herbaspirillum seropedicae]|nr:hypothetical protein Hsc_0501 [Herbaspirillum seropedicae]
MGNGQWAIGNGQWAMGNGQWAMGNGQWAIGNGQEVNLRPEPPHVAGATQDLVDADSVIAEFSSLASSGRPRKE